jgi:hypothetical protein
MASILVDVRRALVEGLADVVGLAEGACEFSWTSREIFAERIWTRRARTNTSSAAMRSGRNFRNEVGQFEVVVLVIGDGETQETTSTRALEIGAVVEDFISDRKNNELGVTGLQTLVIDGDGELAEMFNDNGTLAELTIPVRYTARLT